LLKRISASRVISIRLPEADLAKARRQAASKGLPYQTYVKSLLHEALEKAEKRRAG
jgi:predicted DNA binding CopG/RHH family protein